MKDLDNKFLLVAIVAAVSILGITVMSVGTMQKTSLPRENQIGQVLRIGDDLPLLKEDTPIDESKVIRPRSIGDEYLFESNSDYFSTRYTLSLTEIVEQRYLFGPKLVSLGAKGVIMESIRSDVLLTSRISQFHIGTKEATIRLGINGDYHEFTGVLKDGVGYQYLGTFYFNGVPFTVRTYCSKDKITVYVYSRNIYPDNYGDEVTVTLPLVDNPLSVKFNVNSNVKRVNFKSPVSQRVIAYIDLYDIDVIGKKQNFALYLSDRRGSYTRGYLKVDEVAPPDDFRDRLASIQFNYLNTQYKPAKPYFMLTGTLQLDESLFTDKELHSGRETLKKDCTFTNVKGSTGHGILHYDRWYDNYYYADEFCKLVKGCEGSFKDVKTVKDGLWSCTCDSRGCLSLGCKTTDGPYWSRLSTVTCTSCPPTSC